MNRLLQGALVLMIAGHGVVSYKAWRYRSDARTWHERWLALHSDPAHRVRYRAENERLRNEGVVAIDIAGNEAAICHEGGGSHS